MKSLRVYIVVLMVLIVFFSGLAISLTNYWHTLKIIDSRLNSEMANTAELIRKNLEAGLLDYCEIADDFSRQSAVRTMELDRISALIPLYFGRSNIFYSLYVYDSEGKRVLADNLNGTAGKLDSVNVFSQNTVFSRYVRKAVEEKKPLFSETFLTEKKNIIITYIIPIISPADESRAVGVVSCGMYVDNPRLQEMLERLRPAHGGLIFLLDRKGAVLGSSGKIPGVVSSFDMKNMKKAGDDNLTADIAGVAYRYRLSEIAGTDLLILVAVPDNAVKEIMARDISNTVYYNLLTLVLVLLGSILVSNLLVEPVTMLVKGLQEIGRGNYSHRINIKASGEMESAVSAFNEMADKLQKNRIIEKIWNENWKQ